MIQDTKNLLYDMILFEMKLILSEVKTRASIFKMFIVLFCLKDNGKSCFGKISRNICFDNRFAITNDEETDNLLACIFSKYRYSCDSFFEIYNQLLELIKKFFGEQIEKQIVYNGENITRFQWLLKAFFREPCSLEDIIGYCVDKRIKENFLKVHEFDIQLFKMFVHNKMEEFRKKCLDDFYNLFAKSKFYFPLHEEVSKISSERAKKHIKQYACSKKNSKTVYDFYYNFELNCDLRALSYSRIVEGCVKHLNSDYSREESLKDRFDKMCKILNFDIKDSIVSKIDSDFQTGKIYYLPQKNFFSRWLLERNTKKILKYNKNKQDNIYHYNIYTTNTYSIDTFFDCPLHRISFNDDFNLEYKIKVTDKNGYNGKKNETK